MPQMQPYVVRQGDHLKKIAQARGFDPDKVWNDSNNDRLRAQRKTYNVLLPGDVIHLPVVKREFLPIKLGAVNTFTAAVLRCKISHAVIVDGKPLAGTLYRVTDPSGVPLAPPGTTDGNGVASFDVAASTSEAWLRFEGGRTLRLALGHLDPAECASGCLQRLRHLGYLPLAGEGDLAEFTSDEWVAFALRAFQRDQNLGETGALDSATAAKLAEAFGV